MILLAQVDDASGEVLAAAVPELLDVGASNVQVLASVTKKGRPGHVVLVDVCAEREAEVGAVLAVELGVAGYQALDARHRHCEIREQTVSAVVRAGGREDTFAVRVKQIYQEGSLVRTKAEHEDLRAVHDAFLAAGHRLSLQALRAGVEHEAAHNPQARVTVTL